MVALALGFGAMCTSNAELLQSLTEVCSVREAKRFPSMCVLYDVASFSSSPGG